MGIIKCKMCGGDLVVTPGVTVGECEYCGTRQTLPSVNEELLQNLFNRANLLRMKCEFDKAEQIYEKILQEDASEAEAHWGIVLCKYGIEYVEDPKTYTRIPTCHRTSYDALLSDGDYLAAIEKADPVRRSLYETEGKAIDAIQKNILSIVREEKPFDVFLCYKEADENGQRTMDSVIANEIYHQLTQEGLKVFYAAITLEDKLGHAYEPYIFAALTSARVMLVIGTKPQYFTAVWVKNEWSRFLKLMKQDHSKLLIPCYRDMDAYELPEEFGYLQAQDMGKIGFIHDILRGVRKVCGSTQPAPVVEAAPVHSENKTQLILQNDTMYEGETFAGVPHGYGTARYANGNVYEGNWNLGKRQGKGTLKYSNGDVFVGQYQNDKQDGEATLTYQDGSQWVGQYKDGKRWTGKGVHLLTAKNGFTLRYDGPLVEGQYNGYGKLFYADSTYEGNWLNDQKHGEGTMTWKKGGKFVGQFRADKKWNGNGTWYYEDGYYEGPIVEGMWHGSGKYVWNKGGQWVGTFRNNNFYEGNGTIYTTVDGKADLCYEGEYKNGQRNGYGKMIFTDSTYEGQWLNGKRNGQGTLTWNEGGQWVGQFRDSKCWSGKGVVYTEMDGTLLRYEGDYENGNRNGYGKIFFTDSTYEGQWLNGKRNGQGTLTWNEGGQWVGQFRDSKCWNGSGLWRYNDACYEGSWVNGQRQGPGKMIWEKGGQWVGEFYNDQKWNGQGVWYYRDCRYDGQLVGGQRHGKGIIYWNTGLQWEGSFRRDKPWNGKGVWYYDTGMVSGRFFLGRCLDV